MHLAARRPALALLAAIAALPAIGQTLYWDNNGPTPGSSNVRDTWWPVGDSRLWWSTSAAGDVATQGWVSGATAVFSAGANATGYSLIDIGQGVNVSAIYVEEGSIELWGAYFGGFFYDLSAFDVASGADAILDATLRETSGPINFTKTGVGTLTIKAPNQTTGSFTVSGGTVNIGGVGNLSSGDLTVNNGATLANSGILELNDRTVTVTGAGSTLSSVNYIEFGDVGDVTVNITAGGLVSSQSSVAFGVNPGATGTATVSGSGSHLTSGSQIHVGYYGIGELTVASGGRVTPGTILELATYAGSSGTFNLNSGGTLAVGGTNPIVFGAGAAHLNFGGGTVEVTGSNLIVSVPANLVAGTTSTIDTNGLNALFDGGFSGSGGLAKSGEGTLNLPSANTYSGGTTVNAGTLQLGNLSSLGSPSANLTLNGGILDLGGWTPTVGTAIFNGGAFTNGSLNNASAYEVRSGSLAAPLGGPAALTKTGPGTFTLSGTNTYTGGTVVNDGALAVSQAGNLGSGGIAITGGTLASSAHLSLDRTVTVVGASAGLTTVGYLEIGSTGAGTLTVSDGGQVASGTSAGFGITDTANGAGAITGTDSRLDVGGALYLGYHGVGTLTVASGGTLAAESLQLGIGAGTGAFHLNTGGTLEIGGADAIQSGAGTFNLAGGTLRVSDADLTTSVAATLSNTSTLHTNGRNATLSGVLSGSGVLNKAGAGVLTLAANNTYTGGTVIDDGTVANGIDQALASGHTLIVNASGAYDLAGHDQDLAVIAGAGAIHLGAGALQVGATGAHGTFAGVISGAGDLIKAGAGVLTLTGDNSHTGATTVSAGTLQIGGGGTSGALASSAIINQAALIFNRSDAVTYAGLISGGGTLTKSGAGTLTLSGANEYTGATHVTAGALSVGAAGNLGTGDVQISGGALAGTGNLSFDRSVTATGATASLSTAGYLEFGSAGAGSLTVSAGGTVASTTSTAFGVLGSANGTGLVTGAGSLLTVGGPLFLGYLGEGTLTVAGGGTVSAGSLQLGAAGGIGTFNLDSGGTLALGGSSAITGAGANARFNFGGGTLRVTDARLTTTTPLTLVAATTSTVDTNGLDATLGGVVSGSGALTKSGTGTLTLSGDNTFSGTTTITAGALALGHQNALAGSTLTTANGLSFGNLTAATLGGLSGSQNLSLTNASDAPVALTVGANNQNTTYTGSLSGSGSFTKTGTAPLTLGASHSHSGGTTVAGGSLWLSPEIGLGSGPVNVTAGTIVTNDHILRFPLALDGAAAAWWSTYAGPVSLRNDLGVTNGAQATLTNALYLTPFLASDTITVTVSGENSTLSVPDNLQLTYEQGTGILNIGDGGRVTANYLGIGAWSGGNGRLNLLPGGTFAIGGTNKIVQGGGGAFQFAGGTLEVVGSDLSTHSSVVFSLIDGTTSTVDTNGFNATFGSALSGAGGLRKSGEGTLTFGANNFHTGGTTIEAGALRLLSGGGLGSATAEVTLNGGTLDLGGFDPIIGAAIFNGGAFTNGTLDNASAFEVRTGSLSASLGGSAGLTKTGPGSFTLSGANTYSGGTTVEAGALALGHADALGSGSSVDVASGATLDLNGYSVTIADLDTAGTGAIALGSATLTTGDAADHTLSGSISGPGSLAKIGTGTLTLSGANTYAGTTTIHAGNVAIASAANLGSGATHIGGGALLGTGNLSLDNTFVVDGSASTLSTVGYVEFGSVGAGSLTVTNGGRVTSGTSTAFGVLGSATGAGSVTGTGSRLDVGDVLYLGYLGSGALTVGAGGTITASSVSFSGGGGSGTLTLDMDGTFETGDINTGSASDRLHLSGGTLRITGSAFATSIPVTLSHTSIVDTNGHAATLSGSLSGFGSLAKIGAGTLSLANDNTYTGSTTVSGGAVRIAADSALGAAPEFASFGHLTLDGGTLATTADLTLAANRRLTIGPSGGTLDVAAGTTLSYAAVINNSYTKAGAGTLRLTNVNALAGPVDIAAGTLALVHDTGTISHTFQPAPVSGAGNLFIDLGANDTLTLAPNNTHTGATTLAGGTTILSADTSLGTAPATPTPGHLVFDGGSLRAEGFLTLDSNRGIHLADGGGSLDSPSGSLTYGGVIAGPGALTKIGSGNLTLTGANTHSGGTTISAGTLTANASALPGDVANHSALVFEQFTDATFAGILSGDGTVTKNGPGNLTLAGANTHTGSTTIASGTLTLGHAAALQASTLHLGGAGQLGFGSLASASLGGLSGFQTLELANASASAVALTVGGNDASTTYAGTLHGPGSLTKTGSGTLTLAANSSFTGPTAVQAGTLMLAQPQALQNSTVILDGGSLAFEFEGAHTLGALAGSGNLALTNTSDAAVALFVGGNEASTTYSGALSGAGSLTKTGLGALTLTGNNTHTGGTTVFAGTLQIGAGDGSGLVGGDIVNHGTVAFARSDDYVFAGSISGDGSFVQHGGILRLSTAQTYTGPTTVRAGGYLVLPTTVDQGLATSTTVTLEGDGVLDFSNRALTVAGLTGTGRVYSFGGGSGHLTVNTTAGQDQTFSGALGQGAPHFAFTKSGAGRLTLDGINTFTGLVTISAGTLALGADGSLAASSGIHLGTTGVLDLTAKPAGFAFGPAQSLTGNGTVNLAPGQALTVAGTLAPGNSPGLVTFNGDLLLTGTSVTLMELGGLVRGTGYDAINVTGSMSFGGTLTVTLVNDFTPILGQSFKLFDFSSFGGSFAQVNLPTIAPGLTWNTTNLLSDGTLSVSAIPEPAALAALAAFVALGLAATRRRRL